MAVRNKLLAFDLEVLPVPSYSPDIVPSDYYLFISLKIAFASKKLTLWMIKRITSISIFLANNKWFGKKLLESSGEMEYCCCTEWNIYTSINLAMFKISHGSFFCTKQEKLLGRPNIYRLLFFNLLTGSFFLHNKLKVRMLRYFFLTKIFALVNHKFSVINQKPDYI